jgi:hypothetical protein
LPIAAIVGGAAGGLVLIIVILVIIKKSGSAGDGFANADNAPGDRAMLQVPHSPQGHHHAPQHTQAARPTDDML